MWCETSMHQWQFNSAQTHASHTKWTNKCSAPVHRSFVIGEFLHNFLFATFEAGIRYMCWRTICVREKENKFNKTNQRTSAAIINEKPTRNAWFMLASTHRPKHFIQLIDVVDGVHVYSSSVTPLAHHQSKYFITFHFEFSQLIRMPTSSFCDDRHR